MRDFQTDTGKQSSNASPWDSGRYLQGIGNPGRRAEARSPDSVFLAKVTLLHCSNHMNYICLVWALLGLNFKYYADPSLNQVCSLLKARGFSLEHAGLGLQGGGKPL